MTHFVLTRDDFDSLVLSFGKVPSPLWVNHGVLSPNELSGLRQQGIDVSSFTKFIARSNASEFSDALITIREHHSGQALWVEFERESWQSFQTKAGQRPCNARASGKTPKADGIAIPP
jgi:hypothetical protein